MSRLARNVYANLVSNAWATVLSLVLTPVYVRALGVESYGLIGFYTSCAGLLAILDTGISATAIREIAWLSAREDGRTAIPTLLRTLEVTYWAVIVAISAVLMGAAWSTGDSWFRAASMPPETVRAAMLLMAASLMVQIPSGLYVGGMTGLQRQVESSALIAAFATIRGAGAVAALAIVAADIRVFFIWQFLASAAQTAVVRMVLRRRIGPSVATARFSPDALRAVHRFAGAATLVTALGMLMMQADKLILSRLVSLEAFGVYMLGWTVASGLSRLATPLLTAFGPHFTELVSKGDDPGLARQVRIASQLTATLILPPAALLSLFGAPVLGLWLGKPDIADRVAPLLATLTAGTVLVACSYPAASVLYSRSRLRSLVTLSVVTAVVLLPLLMVAITWFGARGAAACWVVYGLVTYLGNVTLGLRGLPGEQLAGTMLRNLAAPALAAFSVMLICRYAIGLLQIGGPAPLTAMLVLSLVASAAAALAACRDLYPIVMHTARWSLTAAPRST